MSRAERRAAERKIKGGSPHMKNLLERGPALGADVYSVLRHFNDYSVAGKRLKESREDDTNESS
jgi:hypothetical protein